jgi:GxxExxY protein
MQPAALPRSLLAFAARFPDDRACAAFLAELRWPGGFRCECGSTRAWHHASRPRVFQCAICRRQYSVTAGTVMHRAKVPLVEWFWAAWAFSQDKRGVSALQLESVCARGTTVVTDGWSSYARASEMDAKGVELTEQIIGAAIAVHRALGPGLLESTYEACLAFELLERRLRTERQTALPVIYRGVRVDCGYRLDLIVEGMVVSSRRSSACCCRSTTRRCSRT